MSPKVTQQAIHDFKNTAGALRLWLNVLMRTSPTPAQTQAIEAIGRILTQLDEISARLEEPKPGRVG